MPTYDDGLTYSLPCGCGLHYHQHEMRVAVYCAAHAGFSLDALLKLMWEGGTLCDT